VVAATLFGLVLWPCRASAEPSTAEALVDRGLTLREMNRDEEALPLFRRAYELAPTPRLLAQLALAEQAAGAWVAAETHLQSAMAARDDPWIERNRVYLERALARVGEELGWLEIQTTAPDAELWVDGQRVSALPLSSALRLTAGLVMVEVRAPGYEPAFRRISVNAGERARETITLVPWHAVPPPMRVRTDAHDVPDASGPSRTGWFLLATGGVLALGGGFATAVAVHDAAVYHDDALCIADGQTRAQRCGSFDQSRQTAEAVAITLFTGAGAAAGTGAGLLWANPSPPHDPKRLGTEQHPPESSARQTAGWVLVGSGVGLALGASVATYLRQSDATIYNDDGLCLAGGQTRYERCGSYRRAGETTERVSFALYGGSMVMLVTGATLLLTGPRPSANRAAASVPYAGCRIAGLGLSCGGHF
jgi:hypothetical protein